MNVLARLARCDWLRGIGAAAVVHLLFVADAAAVTVPDPGTGCWFQTNGPRAPVGQGDWYTHSSTSSIRRRHLFQIDIPPAAQFPVTVRVLDAESTASAAPDVDVVRNLSDPTRFILFRPDGSEIARETFVSGSANNRIFTATITAAQGPGVYQITSETGALPIFGIGTNAVNDDQNGFRIDVSPDGLGGGLEDDIVVSFTQATLRCSEGQINFRLSYVMPAGTGSATLRNFDLDSIPGPLEYRPPAGSAVIGTISGNAVWNGDGNLNLGGDTFGIASNQAGLWRLNQPSVPALDNVLYEAYANGVQVPMYVGEGAIRVGGVDLDPSGSRETQPGTPVDHPFTARNTGAFADVIDLTTSGTDNRFTVRLLDGSTDQPLFDSNGDGRVDTGTLAAGASRALKLRVTPGPEAMPGGTDRTRVTGCSALQRVSTPGQDVCDAIVLETRVVDTIPPDPPVITFPADGAVLNDSTPTIAGTSEPLAQIEVFVDGVLAGRTQADPQGTWQFTTSPLADGPHTVAARAIDLFGNRSALSRTVNFRIDTVAPEPPVVNQPADGSFIRSPQPTIAGTTEPNASVEIFVDDLRRATVTADNTGAWSYRLSAEQALMDGLHAATARATDAAGNVSELSAPSSFTVDTVAPASPVLTAPPAGAQLATTRPTISGTAEAGARVDVFVDGAVVGTVAAASDGSWSYTLAAGQELSQGTHSATATATDAAGNTSPPADTRTFTVDTVPPAAPAIGTPADGAAINDSTPDVTGTAEAGATVTVFVDGTERASATAGPGGSWNVTISPALAEGSHSVFARARDAAGNTSEPSSTNTFTVDTTVPAPPVIESPVDGSFTSDNTPTVSGSAEANATVRVFLDGSNAGTTTADGVGRWSITLAVVTDGTHQLRAQARDRAGNPSGLSPIVTFTVDTMAPATPLVTQPADGSYQNSARPVVSGAAEPFATVTVILDGESVGTAAASDAGAWTFTPRSDLRDGEHRVAAFATDRAGNASATSASNGFTVDTQPPAPPSVDRPLPGALVNTPRPTISGGAEPGASVEVRVDGTLVGTVVSETSGAWSYTLTQAQSLSDGGHNVTAVAVDRAGNRSSTTGPLNFTVDTMAPAAPVVTEPAGGSRTNDPTPTVAGTAEAGARVEIFVDSVSRATVTADGTGRWSYTLTEAQALAEGNHTASAQATDAAGNTGPASVPQSFTVDLTAPPPPQILQPVSGTSTNDSTPTVRGSAEAFATVDLYVDGARSGSATADGAGNWAITLAPLSDGTYVLTATATDGAGNASGASAPSTVTVDTVRPAAPTIVSPAEGAWLNTRTPTISGQAEAGARVTVFDGTTSLGSATADAVGAWSFAVPAASGLSDGAHVLTARATDAAGNEGPTSEPRNVTVDTAAPAAPLITAPRNGATLSQPRPTVSGTAEIGTTVAVFIDGNPIGTALAGEGGTWSVTPQNALPDGDHTATATATDNAGNTSASATPVSFRIDTSVPGTVRIDSPVNDARVNDPTPTLVGFADAGSRVEVFVDGGFVGSATADGSGSWTFTVPDGSPLSEGEHVLTAQAVNQAGTRGPLSDPVAIVVDVTPPAAPVITQPADGARVGTRTPTFAGTAGAGDRVEVRVDGVLVGSVVTSGSGSWSYTLSPAQALAEGAHSAVAVARDTAGNGSGDSNTVSFLVDVTAPDAPVLTEPANGSRINTARPTIAGRAEAGVTVQITLDDSPIATVSANGSGAWSYTLSEAQALAEGTYVARATAIDAAGNPSATSVPVSFTVDLTAPAAPVITSPVEGATVGTPTPAFRGTAEPLATVELSIDGVAVGTTRADATGAWSHTLTADHSLLDGTYQATAIATDGAGNASEPSGPRTFHVDTRQPAPPRILAPADGARLNTSTPTVSGEADPGTRVAVSIDGVLRGEVPVAMDGTWSYTLTPGQALADGEHQATAVARTDAGAVSAPSDPVRFSIDTVPPPVPQILSPADGTRTRDAQPEISGTSQPGTSVQIFFGDRLVATVAVTSGGTWSHIPAPLADGTYVITARAVDDHGNPSGRSTPVSLTVDRTPPAAPVVTSPPDGGRTNNPTPSVSGTTEPAARVEVFVDGALVGTVTADGTGAWRYTLNQAQVLADGMHTASARATDVAGNVGPASAPNSFVVDTAVPPPPVITRPGSGALLNDATPEIAGTAEPGVRVLVSVDGVQVGSVVVAADGTWTYTPTAEQALSDGNHRIVARAIDGAGNPSGLSAPVDLSVDTVPPGVPAVLQPANGTQVPSRSPLIAGTGESGSEVEVVVDGRVLGTATVGADGSWSFEPSADQELADGEHVVTAVARDAAGNRSEPSAAVTFIVDTVAPTAPQVLLPANGSFINDPTPDIVGLADPDTEVEVVVDGVPAGRVRSDGGGNFTLTVVNALADGPHEVLARARDTAGNVADSTVNRFTVDTVAPTRPTLERPAATENSATPEAAGTAEPGSTVEVYVDGQLVGSTQAGPDGSWSLPLPPLPDGQHTVRVVAVDAAGNESAAASREFGVDTTVPLPPVIVEPVSGQSYLEPPTVRGTAEPGTKVVVSLDGAPLPEVQTAADSTWSLTFPADRIPAPGEHTLVAIAIDRAGNMSRPSNEVRFHIGQPLADGGGAGAAGGGGCGCSAQAPDGGLALVALLLAAIALWRRRARRALHAPGSPPAGRRAIRLPEPP